MNTRLIALLVASAAMLCMPMPATAHHSAAAFDVAKEVTLNGVVTDWSWINPHCLLQFDVADTKGKGVEHWIVEASNPRDMTNRGWAKGSLKRGDRVTITVQPARNGKPVGRIAHLVLPGGKRLAAFSGGGLASIEAK